jgi:hypothetical protein
MLERWNFTVCSVTHSVRVVSLFVDPAATSRSTSSSRAGQHRLFRGPRLAGRSLDQTDRLVDVEHSAIERLADQRGERCRAGALETAALAPASRISSSREDSGDSVSTITAILSRSALISRMSSTARSDWSISSIRTRSGPASRILSTDADRASRWPSRLNSPLLRKRDSDRFDGQRVLGDYDE